MSQQTRNIMKIAAKRLTGIQVGIPPRHLRFRFPKTASPMYVYQNNPMASTLLGVFSAIFPPGERFFVDSVRHFRDQITDPRLNAEVAGFIGQEAMHGREHERLNAWYEEHGMDLSMPERVIRMSLAMLRKLPPSQQLACTTMMEHFTAHLAEQWLTDQTFRTSADQDMLPVWTWHGLEELEHKAVAYDVHQAVSKHEHLERLLAFPLVLFALAPGIFFSWGWLVVQQGEALNLSEHRRGLKVLFGKGGFLTKVLAHIPDFLRKDFHPNQQNTAALEAEWREALFGEHGVLNDSFTNRDTVMAKAG